jgi:hypothetical protein
MGAEPDSANSAEESKPEILQLQKESTMNLTERGDIIQWPETHYVFVEKTGPIPKIAPEAWQMAYSLAPQLAEENQIVGYMSLYRTNPNVYRAGFQVAEEPVEVPAGLTGPYSDLPAATGRVFEIIAQRGMMLRSDFCIESYVNNPRSTPEDKLITEILIPTA